ncbi:hypothetical protein BD310DRAFT_980918 [Dichomitus squalens]|uniref:BTB domain-containing protein n=1 Tax=Dichomitus squalens TaxID=114155 RepID=A0A4Q9PI69_9APHY|nr:hypothetical protein BD310DRAFT_980918 [Dichomitus squalens]
MPHKYTSPSDAPHPFNQPSADITLRTSNAVDFHVHTAVLSIVSPVFATMFQLPQPQQPHREEATGTPPTRPIIEVAEDSRSLDPLLRLCYPVKKAELRTPKEIQPVLAAAIKYDMEWPTEILTKAALDCASSYPLGVWATGCRLGLESVARRGAEAYVESVQEDERKKLLYIPRITSILDEMQGISASHYYRLLNFLHSAKGVADTVLFVHAPRANGTPRSQAALDESSKREASECLPFADDAFPSIAYPAEEVPSSDVICRCPDGMELRAHQSILSVFSPVLKRRIAAINAARENNQPSDSPRAIPVLELRGRSIAVCALLAICYHPETELLPYGINRCIDLLAAATVYKVRHVIDLAFARWKSLVDCDPLSSYFLAHRRGLAAAAAVAASGTLAISGVSMQQISVLRIMDELPAWTYHVLLEYHDACSHAVSEQLDDAKTEFAIASGFGGKTSSPREANCLYKSVSRRLNEQQEALKERTVAPKADHVAGLRNLADVATDIQYHKLWPVTYNLLTRLTETLPQRIEDAIGKVKFDIEVAT